jgi:hypothetical protein
MMAESRNQGHRDHSRFLAEPFVAADGAGITAFQWVKSFQPPPVLDCIVRRLRR